MGLMNKLLGLSIGGGIGLVLASIFVPMADTQIASQNLTDSNADTLYDKLPLFLVVALMGAILGYVMVESF